MNAVTIFLLFFFYIKCDGSVPIDDTQTPPPTSPRQNWPNLVLFRYVSVMIQYESTVNVVTIFLMFSREQNVRCFVLGAKQAKAK